MTVLPKSSGEAGGTLCRMTAIMRALAFYDDRINTQADVYSKMINSKITQNEYL